MNPFDFDHLVGFGEAMLRLSTPPGQSFDTTPAFAAHVGGAELNGLIAAQRCDMKATWATAFDESATARRMASHADRHGVSVISTVDANARMGSYFVEMAPYPRSVVVSYDRGNSAFAAIEPGDIDWASILSSSTCFYATGITAGVSKSARHALDEAIAYACSVGSPVALDINYRSALWSSEEAYGWVRELLPKVNILSASVPDLNALGVDTDEIQLARERLGVDVLLLSRKVQNFAGVEVFLGVATADTQYHVSGQAAVVDPLGAGDAMVGSFLACSTSSSVSEALDVALRAALFSYGVDGDALIFDPRRGLTNGRIER